ncbi:MAG: hypothetical protein J6J24_04205 [Clostridia bacterium]|nr:hypothetical protein [Clostridia bacterium]
MEKCLCKAKIVAKILQQKKASPSCLLGVIHLNIHTFKSRFQKKHLANYGTKHELARKSECDNAILEKCLCKAKIVAKILQQKKQAILACFLHFSNYLFEN